ncbi:MAG: helix-turn-helix transcriptional regulator [Candidatus Protistobacter heckmanni]|nr:helix-turn-helix transcriptional regulator [Candidatus Protistobacter heckmanni]
MFKVNIEPHWRISKQGGDDFDATTLLQLLTEIHGHRSITTAAKNVGLSYRHVWGLLQTAEATLGFKLLDAQRGRGADLTELAKTLLWADRLIGARLSPTLQTLASELESELQRVTALAGPETDAALRLHASHGFAEAALLEALAAAEVRVELGYRHSSEAVASLARGECDMAGFHVPLGEFEKPAIERYRQWLDPRKHVLVHLALRSQGMFLPRGNPRKIRGLEDLVQPRLKFVNRQAGSGTRLLIDMMLAKAGLDSSAIQGFDTAEFTHAAVAAHVASGMADVGIGVETAARRFGLDFLPLLQERYFFAVDKKALKRYPVNRTVELIRSPAYKEQVRALRGYDAASTGLIQTLSEAFPD